MELILTFENPFPDVTKLFVYAPIKVLEFTIYPIQLGPDIFKMKWSEEDKWRCDSFHDQERISAIARIIEEHDPNMFNEICHLKNIISTLS